MQPLHAPTEGGCVAWRVSESYLPSDVSSLGQPVQLRATRSRKIADEIPLRVPDVVFRAHRLSPADLRRAPIEPCRRPSSVEIWVRYGRSIGIEAAIETPVSMIFSIPQRTLHSTFGRRQQFQEGSHNCFFDWSDPWMLVSRHNF